MAEKSDRPLPPGPKGSCLFGNSFDMDLEKVHISFTEIGKEYGDIFTLKTPGKTIVVVNSYDAFSELFLSDTYGELLSGRENNFASLFISKGKSLSLSSSSPCLRKRREILRESIDDFAKNQTTAQHKILGNFLNHIKAKGDSPQDLGKAVKQYVKILSMGVLSGEQYQFDDPRLVKLIEHEEYLQFFLHPKVSGRMSLCPALRFSPFGAGATFRKINALSTELQKEILDPIKVSYTSGRVRGGIDRLLKARREAGIEEQQEWTDEIIWASAESVLAAGNFVFEGYLLYFIVVLLHHREISDAIREEVDTVIGRDKLPSMDYLPSMPFTEATMLELLRWVTPAPALVPRRVEEDIQFREYTIPKDTTLITNAWHIHHNVKTWLNPWTFIPERFLSGGKKIDEEKRKKLIPFGEGTRKCIGIELAWNTAFHVITALVQRFDIEAVGEDLPPLDPHFSMEMRAGIIPKPFTVKVKPREK